MNDVNVTDMVNYFYYLDSFVNEMKAKVIERSRKYPNEDTQTFSFIKEHLIDEIIEMFDLSDDEVNIVKPILMKCVIDSSECVDVANMCWIYSFISKKKKSE